MAVDARHIPEFGRLDGESPANEPKPEDVALQNKEGALERMEKEDTRGIWSKSMMPYP
jgi:hypothetical protein